MSSLGGALAVVAFEIGEKKRAKLPRMPLFQAAGGRAKHRLGPQVRG